MIKYLQLTDDYAILFSFIDSLRMDSERAVQQGLGWFLCEAWKIYLLF